MGTSENPSPVGDGKKRILARNRSHHRRGTLDLAAYGFAAATIELPGSGDRTRLAAAEQARADLRQALAAGDPVDEIVMPKEIKSDRSHPPSAVSFNR